MFEILFNRPKLRPMQVDPSGEIEEKIFAVSTKIICHFAHPQQELSPTLSAVQKHGPKAIARCIAQLPEPLAPTALIGRLLSMFQAVPGMVPHLAQEGAYAAYVR